MNCLKFATLCLALVATQSVMAQGSLEDGKKLFNQTAVPQCSICHALKHAGAVGEVGPNLDEMKPDAARVTNAIKNGIGLMPAFPKLTEEQVNTLANYVSSTAGR